MKIQAWYQTDVGLRRENNQDSYLVDPELGLYIVADGMGGHRGGEVASAMAVEAVRRVVKEGLANKREIPWILSLAYKTASKEIFERSSREMHLRGMATTMVLALFHQDRLYFANVGDSRAYLIGPPGLWQVTEDHSLFNEQVKAGLVREMDHDKFEGKNIITRSVGFEEDVVCDIQDFEVKKGQMFVLCSDGLSGMVSDQSLMNICLTMSPHEAVPRLISEAKKNGGDDNVTVILLKAC